MYVLRSKINNAYFYMCKNGQPRIFTFNTIEAAQKALQFFQEFSLQQILSTGDIFGTGSAMQVANSFELEEITEKNKFDNTISFEEVMKEKGYEI